MDRRVHTDSPLLRLGRKESDRLGYDTAALEDADPAVIEDMGIRMSRRRRIALAATLSVAAVAGSFISNRYDQKYDGCDVGDFAASGVPVFSAENNGASFTHSRAIEAELGFSTPQEDAAQQQAYDAAEAGCYHI